MIPEHLVKPTFSRLRDIQVQADKILKGNIEQAGLDAFASYSGEMKKFLVDHVSDEECLLLIHRIPVFDPGKLEIPASAFSVLLGGFLGAMFRDRAARNALADEVAVSRGIYASIELRLRMISTY